MVGSAALEVRIEAYRYDSPGPKGSHGFLPSARVTRPLPKNRHYQPTDLAVVRIAGRNLFLENSKARWARKNTIFEAAGSGHLFSTHRVEDERSVEQRAVPGTILSPSQMSNQNNHKCAFYALQDS